MQANVGEVIAWRNLFWGLSDAMVRAPKPWIGNNVLPNMDPGNAYQIIATMAYVAPDGYEPARRLRQNRSFNY